MIYIDPELMPSLSHWFNQYVNTFISPEKDVQNNILLKQRHTQRVCDEILEIGRQIGLNADELRFAETIALFHDIGRFEQYARYNTFADYKSENHAHLGVKILKETGVLNCLDDGVKDLVYRIVSFHNRAGLPRDETELCLFYAKLLRDADKLDIWKVLTTHYLCLDETLNKAIELELPDTPGISDKVYEAVIDKKIVDSRHVRNLNDFKALQIGWVFDINFKPALDAVIRRNYIEVICSVLPACEQMERIKAVVGRYIETRFMDEPVSTAR